MGVSPDFADDETRRRLNGLFRYGQVGRCVSSVTHDVNNYLGAIQAYAEMARMDPGLGPDARKMLGKVNEAVGKATALLGTLTSVARPYKPRASMIDIASFVVQTVELKQYDCKFAQVQLETQIVPPLPNLVVDEPLLRLALIYLLMNAMEAAQDLENARERRVRVRVRAEEGAVVIETWNSGPEIPQDERERMFDPFHTTKGEEHIGLGLALACEAARRHDGELAYDPATGFALRLPKANRLAELL